MERTAASTPFPAGRASGALLPDELVPGPARLVVTDLDRAADWYRDVVGLPGRHDTDVDGPRVARLSTSDGASVVELLERPDAPRPGRTAGLYHVALLYPSRQELARAVERIAAAGTPVQGASDHGTHEAIYLPDPDGNGLELAADRPRSEWPDLRNVDAIMPRALDLQDLLATVAEDPAVPARAADGLRVGHVHLHVGDVEQARAHYVDVVGFELVTGLDTAAFASAGGYHHHLAWNTWRGDGVPAPDPRATGLAWWSVLVPTGADLDALAARLDAAGADWSRDDAGDEIVVRDPWGIELHVRRDAAGGVPQVG